MSASTRTDTTDTTDLPQRSHDRQAGDMRPIRFERNFTDHAPGSVLASFGETRVLCTASWQDKVPPFLQGKGKGWLTAEYSMLPSSTNTRKARDRGGKVDGRSVEIQRLIGRSLRAVMNFKNMTERTIWVDCDVIQADGGTRTVSISGAWVALFDCLKAMEKKRILRAWPLETQLAAVSVGVVGGAPYCDLDYKEDSTADVDMNLVMTGEGSFVEIQGSAEGATFSKKELDTMLEHGEQGIQTIFQAQREALSADE